MNKVNVTNFLFSIENFKCNSIFAWCIASKQLHQTGNCRWAKKKSRKSFKQCCNMSIYFYIPRYCKVSFLPFSRLILNSERKIESRHKHCYRKNWKDKQKSTNHACQYQIFVFYLEAMQSVKLGWFPGRYRINIHMVDSLVKCMDR